MVDDRVVVVAEAVVGVDEIVDVEDEDAMDRDAVEFASSPNVVTRVHHHPREYSLVETKEKGFYIKSW